MSRPRWRLIRSGPATGAWNMALDEALLESVASGRSLPILRLYGWQPPTVTLGYAQRLEASVNLETCRRLGFDVVRRITGGRAVLHDREVTYSVISPERSTLFPGGILENYRVISCVLQQTLDSFGLETSQVASRSRSVGHSAAQQSACFTAPATWELLHAGCKMTGSAQKRQGDAFLQHGSIPVELDPQKLFLALDTEQRLSPAAGGKLLAQSIGWLNRWLPQAVTMAEVEERLLACFARMWGAGLIEDQPTSAERTRAAQLSAAKYEEPAWTLNRQVR
jgi:lipoyl(octanoyl) transferase